MRHLMKAIGLLVNILPNIPRTLRALEGNLKTMRTTILILTRDLHRVASHPKRMGPVKLTAKMSQALGDIMVITITMATMDTMGIVTTRIVLMEM